MDDELPEIPWGELTSDEIVDLFAEEGTEISVDEAAVLRQIIAAAGSLDAAIDALEQLDRQRDAA